jgi:hypothetical protein
MYKGQKQLHNIKFNLNVTNFDGPLFIRLFMIIPYILKSNPHPF